MSDNILNKTDAHESNKILVLTWALPIDLEVYKNALALVNEYCLLHGYSRVIETRQYNFSEDADSICTELFRKENQQACRTLSGYFYKPIVMKEYCSKYDWILYLDADIGIAKKDIPVEYFIRSALPTTAIIASFLPPRVNNGVFLLRGGNECFEFIDHWLNFGRHYGHDNGKFNLALMTYDNPAYKQECQNLLNEYKPKVKVFSPTPQMDACINDVYGITGNCNCTSLNISPKKRFSCESPGSLGIGLQGEDADLADSRRHCTGLTVFGNSSFTYHSKYLRYCDREDHCIPSLAPEVTANKVVVFKDKNMRLCYYEWCNRTKLKHNFGDNVAIPVLLKCFCFFLLV